MAVAIAQVLDRSTDYESAGMSATNGGAAALNAVAEIESRYGKAHADGIRNHSSRNIRTVNLSGFAAIYAMDRGTAWSLKSVVGVTVPSLDVPDPYGGSSASYQRAADLIRERIVTVVAPTRTTSL